MPAKSRDQEVAARIAKAIKAGRVKAKPGSPSAKMARSMSSKQLGHFTKKKKKKK